MERKQPNNRQFEMVNYRLNDIAYVTASLIKNIATYSGIEGTENWLGSIIKVVEKIKDESPNSSSFIARGLSLNFSGIPHAVIPTVKDTDVIFSTGEPHFSFTPTFVNLPHSKWAHIENVIDQISKEMCEVYYMRLDDRRHLVFPNEEYAKTATYNIILVN